MSKPGSPTLGSLRANQPEGNDVTTEAGILYLLQVFFDFVGGHREKMNMEELELLCTDGL